MEKNLNPLTYPKEKKESKPFIPYLKHMGQVLELSVYMLSAKIEG